MKKNLLSIIFALISTLGFSQAPNYVPANGLVGWWPFNGNANDESGNGNNGFVGVNIFSSTDRNGLANNALRFLGGGYCGLPATINIGLDSTSSRTLSLWCYSEMPSYQGGYIFKENKHLWLLGLNPQNDFHNITGAYYTSSQYFRSGQHPLPYNWTNFVFICDSINQESKFYINGLLVSNYTPITNTPPFVLGPNYGIFIGGDGSNNSFHGKLDDIGIWNRALTECEIQNLYISTNSTNTMTTVTACDSYLWNGTTYTSSGVYTGTTTNCVTESLNLTITPSSTNTTTATACDSYTWNGQTYSTSGTYTGTTANCVTQSLNLTITPSSTNTTTSSACNSYTWNGTTYTSSGVYTGTTANCVMQSLNLTITPNSTNTTTVAACNNYAWNGQTYTQSGVYTGTTTNCVTQALNLTINTNTSSSISQTALDSYTWPVNSQTYTTTGAYTAVITNAAGCDSTITLNLTMSFTGINDLSASKLSIYPNPTNGDFTITGLELVGTVSSLTLTDMNGKVVKVLDTKATKFSMGSIKPGVYFLNILSENKQQVLKIVKE